MALNSMDEGANLAKSKRMTKLKQVVAAKAEKEDKKSGGDEMEDDDKAQGETAAAAASPEAAPESNFLPSNPNDRSFVLQVLTDVFLYSPPAPPSRVAPPPRLGSIGRPQQQQLCSSLRQCASCCRPSSRSTFRTTFSSPWNVGGSCPAADIKRSTNT